MSAVLSGLPRHLIPKPQITPETIFHPLAELIPSEHQQHNVNLLENSPAVLLKEHVYVGDYHYRRGATCGQLWKYSRLDGSWNILETPHGAVTDYCLAVWSDKLVLITANILSNTIWIRQGEKWECQNIRNTPDGRIVSATGYKTLLFAITLMSESYLSVVFCDRDKELYWSEPTTGPIVDSYSGARITCSINVHEMTLYAIAHMNGQISKFVSAPIAPNGDVGKLSELNVAGNIFPSKSKLTIFGNRLIVVAVDFGNQLKLYTPFNDMKQNRLSLVEFDELDHKYESIHAVFGLEKSLHVIGKESASGLTVTTVVKFTSEVAAYDCNSQFTINAFKRLEVVAEIPVLTGDHFGESQLSGIMQHAGFSLCSTFKVYPALVIRYMENWLRQYKENDMILKPSWGKLLEALETVGLVDLRKEIKECLETAPEVVEVKVEQATGIEEMRKLHVQLKRMYDQSNTEEATDLGMTQQFKEDIYRQCSTMSRKVESQIKQLMDENKEVKTDKEQLEKQLQQLEQKNLRLNVELSKRDEPPPCKRPHINDSEGSTIGSTVEKSSASHQPSTLTLPNLIRELCKIASKWENIGVLLYIDDGDLQSVKSDNKGDSISCLREMLRIWLKKCDPQPSWQLICDALVILGEEKRGKEIREKYIQ